MKVKKIFLFLFLTIFLFIGCIDEQTLKLIDSSVSTGNLISEYYDTLIQCTIETWELEAFNSSLRELDFSEEDQKEYQKTIEHLEARKKVVDSFINIFSSLEEFINDKSPEDLKAASIVLGNNIGELKPLKDNNITMPSTVFGNLSEDIFEIYKVIEIRHTCKTLLAILEKINDLFVKEKDLYASIIEERNNKSQIVVNYMIDNEFVASWPLIESAPGTIDLKIASASKPAKDKKTKEAIKKVAEVKYYRMEYLTRTAQADLIKLNNELIKEYKDFIAGKKLVFDNIAYMTSRITNYYTDIDSYINKVINRYNDYSADESIIYHGNTETKVFHQPSCSYYYSKNSDDVFYSREDAIEAGYTPCKFCKP